MTENKLWFKQPAENWNEALPVGNGILGMMVFGGIREEQVQLNEETFWSGWEYPEFDDPQTFIHLDEMRQLVFAGKYTEAQQLCNRYPAERLDEIVDIASEALCTRRATFSLGKDTYPYALVKDRLLRLNASHIGYIIGCIDGNTTEIHQIKPYLLKTLINAPATMESYYTTKVNHDLHGNSR